MIHLLKRAALACAFVLGLAGPALAAPPDCTTASAPNYTYNPNPTANATYEATVKTCAALGALATDTKLEAVRALLAAPLAVTVNAGENHVGEVGGNQATVTVPLTVTSGSAYAAGNAVDGLKTIAGAARVAGGSGMVQSISLAFKSAQTAGADVYIFASSPTGTTVTDKTAFSLASADADKPIGISHVTDCKTAGTTTFCQSQREAMPYALSAGTSLYAVVVTTGTPTFQSTSDAILTVRILRN